MPGLYFSSVDVSMEWRRPDWVTSRLCIQADGEWSVSQITDFCLKSFELRCLNLASNSASEVLMPDSVKPRRTLAGYFVNEVAYLGERDLRLGVKNGTVENSSVSH